MAKYNLIDLQGTGWFENQVFNSVSEIRETLISRLRDSGELPENVDSLSTSELAEICHVDVDKDEEGWSLEDDEYFEMTTEAKLNLAGEIMSRDGIGYFDYIYQGDQDRFLKLHEYIYDECYFCGDPKEDCTCQEGNK